MSDTSKPQWTQSMSMHQNGGSKFSQLNFRLYRDGKFSGIIRITRTGGSPKYLKTIDELQAANGETYDVLGKRGSGMLDWCEAHFVESKEE
jgi:hypothetical protein